MIRARPVPMKALSRLAPLASGTTMLRTSQGSTTATAKPAMNFQRRSRARPSTSVRRTRAVRSGKVPSKSSGTSVSRTSREMSVSATNNLIARRGADGRQETALGSLGKERGETSAAVSSGVDCDAVVEVARLLDDAMAMDDDRFVTQIAVEEVAPDPAQIMRVLVLDRDTGPDAGVDEQIITDPEAVVEAAQEIDVQARHREIKLLGEERGVELRLKHRRDAVALGAFRA